MSTRTWIALATAAAIGVGGCGAGGKPALTVSAAASLRSAFTAYGRQFTPATARFSFAGSDTLAAQIEQGVKPDVFASANLKLPALLFARGLLERPVAFTANRLVLAVPAGSRITTLRDAEKPGLKLSLGTQSVPVGDYTRTVLGRLPRQERNALTANVRDIEPDVSGIVGKLTQGAVDAGFLYATDVVAAHGQLKALALPAELKPAVAYAIAVVRHSPHAAQARAWIAGVVSGTGQQDLLRAGFLALPAS